MTDQVAVLFVCLGNICRSPLAEAAFRQEIARRCLAISIDSAGTGGWHAGDPPDLRAQAVARRHGIEIGAYRARQVTLADFRLFTHILALDQRNLSDLQAMRPTDAVARVGLLLDHVAGREGQSVADPYYGDEAGFSITWDEVRRAATGLAHTLFPEGRRDRR